MKKISFTLTLLLVAVLVTAADLTGLKIYINPGHGGYDGANDRNVLTIPYAYGDTLGFWESSSNLRKGLHLNTLLKNSGATVIMSRKLNRDEDDRSLSEISEEANANQVDAFLSIHSNAVGANKGTNYLLLLYHGYDNNPTIAQSLPMANAAWPRLIENELTVWTHYTTSMNTRGDYSFYGNTSGLGVLRSLTVPGFLSEGSFHDYQPETHRLLNVDYCKLEAVRFHRYFCDYFYADLPTTGIIAGYVKGADQVFTHPLYTYKSGSDDSWLPLNGSRVKLMNAAGDSLDFYQVDTLYNGIFVFDNLTPGTYKLNVQEDDHIAQDATIEVTAATTSYAKMMLVNPNIVVPKDTTPNYPAPIQEAGTVALNHYEFGAATPTLPEWLNTTDIKRMLYRNEKYYVLTTEPKIFIFNAINNELIKEMDLTGVAGGMITLSDIDFTADGYLLACNKQTVGLPENQGRFFKVYTWDNDNAAPSLLFQTQSQGNWSNGVMGETFAVSGSRWKCKIYTPSVTTGSTKAIRIVGLSYEEDNTQVGYQYMMGTPNYTEGLWGEKLKFTVSPTGNDHLYVDSELIQATEYQFDWKKPDREPLVNKGSFAEKSGYTIQPVASGNFYFRNANQVFMAAPVCQEDSTQVGVVLFNISEGLDNAVKISDELPASTNTVAKAPFMAAAAKVNGYNIDLMIVAQGQGVARYKTLTPATVANVYASELNLVEVSSESGTIFELEFTLNDEASVVVEIMEGENIVKTIEAGLLSKGRQSVIVNEADLADGTYTWKVTASAHGIDRPMKISNDNLEVLQFYSPRGVAVDNNINSEFFGRVYASESDPGSVTKRTTKDGIYILNAALEDVTNQGADSYAGGVAWGVGLQNVGSPMRVSVGEDSRVYLTDWSDTNPGVWIMDPANPSENFKPVFSGLTISSGLAKKDGVNVHGSISHSWATGVGEDTKLFTFDKYYVDATATNRGNVLQYNIGKLEAPWQSAPSAIVYNDGLNGNLQQNYNSSLAPDGRGGWWLSQYRAEDNASIPSLIHIKPDGTVTFNSGETPTLIGNSVMGGMAVNAAGDVIAMGCSNEVKVFAISFNEDGIPSLSLLHSIKPAMGVNTTGISYDLAGNLYVISNSTERLGVWAMPKVDNTFVTPSPESKKIVVGKTQIKDLEDNSIKVRVYPNPANDYVIIDAGDLIIQRVEVLDMNGRLVQTEKFQQSQPTLSLQNLQKGFYLLKVRSDQGEKVLRIIKQ